MDSLPITNNNRLSFLQHNPTKTIVDMNNGDDVKRQQKYFPSESQKNILPNHPQQKINRELLSNENIKNTIFKTFASNFVYCLILGLISFISGLLLSIIAFHGLQTSKVTPIMGRKHSFGFARPTYIFLCRSRLDTDRCWKFSPWSISLLEQQEDASRCRDKEKSLSKL